MRRTWFKSGDWNVLCDRCGFKFKASDLSEEPRTGFMVCKKCWEPWHPQEVIRPIPDQQKLPWTRPEPNDTFINKCTVNGLVGIAGIGTAGCAIVGRTGPLTNDTLVANRVAGDV